MKDKKKLLKLPQKYLHLTHSIKKKWKKKLKTKKIANKFKETLEFHAHRLFLNKMIKMKKF